MSSRGTERLDQHLLAPRPRESALLVAILILAVTVRIVYASTSEGSQGWGSQVLTNANLAMNLADGRGYVETLSADLGGIAPRPDNTVPWEVLRDAPTVPGRTPSPYFLPGYPYIVSAFWQVTGTEGYISAQIMQALADGVLGCLSLFVLLACVGRVRAGLVAATAYAVAPPAVLQAGLVLPDSLSNAANLPVLAAVVAGFALRRPLLGALAGGLMLGAGSWIRGDAVLLLPFLLAAVFFAAPLGLRDRGVWSVLFIAAWALPSLLLASFFEAQYDEFHLTRPGSGILLWEGIGQQENPWGITAPPGQNLDAAASALIESHGLQYGSWAGDGLLRDQALSHMRERPGWFIVPTLQRFLRVVTFTQPPEAPSTFSGRVETLRTVVGYAGLLVGVAGIWLMRGTLLGAFVLAAWLSRALPFSFLRDEVRFEVLLVGVYVLLGAVVMDHLLDRWAARQRAVAAAVIM